MENKRSPWILVCVYSGLILLASAVFYYINKIGLTYAGTQDFAVKTNPTPGSNPLFQFLLALVVVIFVARFVGALFARINQPPVLGEVLGGILLGPSLFGATLFPPTVASSLNLFAQIGIILFMFLVGIEVDLKTLKKSGHATLAISHLSIVIPFILGSGLALWLFPLMAPLGVGFTTFALFLGVSMSVTAFPVLARILTDQNLHRTKLGVLALTCAAIDDVTAWCMLAFVVAIARAQVSGAVVTFALTIAYVVFMLMVVRPFVTRALANFADKPKSAEVEMAFVLLAVLTSALITEYIGIHALFGAFLLGAITPSESRIAHDLSEKLQAFVRVLFLPAFFAYTGLRTQISLVNGLDDWLWVAVIIAIAIIGKFGGAFVAAKISGMSWRDSTALGVLMNTRGLVELIVLNIGLDIGVITPRLFTMLVLMALVTTFMTGPLIQILLRKQQRE